jgi:hypothetical protein
MWIRIPSIRRLVRLIPVLGARIERAEAIAFQEVGREAFLAGTLTEAPKPAGSGSSGASIASVRWLERPLEAVIRTETIAQPRDKAIAEVTDDSEDEAALAETLAVDATVPGRQRRRQSGSSSPAHLLQTPANVAPVVDDFLDGLIRRVEGDR